MELQFVDAEGVQLAEWLENVLKAYCVNLAKRKLGNPPEGQKSPSAEAFEEVKKKMYLFISTIKFDKFKKEAEDLSEDLLKVEIGYYVGDKQVLRKEHLLIHVSRTVQTQEQIQSIEKILETEKRQIDFYTILVPELEIWAMKAKVNTKFALPTCFFGQYEEDKPEPLGFFDFPPEPQQQPAQAQAQGELGDQGELGCPLHGTQFVGETRSILILHDLDKVNFRKTGDDKFSVAEVKAVLRELAQIHATSWAYQKVTKKPLGQTWPFLLRPKESVPVCVTLIEEGIDAFLDCFKTRLKKVNAVEEDLADRLVKVRPKLSAILYVLMTPPIPPNPSCVINLDLQYRNVALRQMNGKPLPTQHKLKSHKIECRITQWKLASVGSPMHDVAFLLLTSLAPEIRRQHTKELIQFYYQAFRNVAKRFDLRLGFKRNLFEAEFEKSIFLALLLIIGNFEEGMTAVPDVVLESFQAALEDVAASGFL